MPSLPPGRIGAYASASLPFSKSRSDSSPARLFPPLASFSFPSTPPPARHHKIPSRSQSPPPTKSAPNSKISLPPPFPPLPTPIRSYVHAPPPQPHHPPAGQPMDRRLRSPAPRADERQRGGGSASPHRFLRPGALARLRDSKVLARSLRCAARVPLPPPSNSSSPLRSPAPAAAVPASGDGVPCFLGIAARGMRYPLRKKLAAARGVVFLPPSEAVEAFMDAFAVAPSSDLVAAH
ncbi:unnamed protein product [Urochloa humidicola]